MACYEINYLDRRPLKDLCISLSQDRTVLVQGTPDIARNIISCYLFVLKNVLKTSKNNQV